MKKLFKPVIQFYLKILTKITLWRHKPLIIAIAGTTNKTFVKEVILDELGRGNEVRGNPKSFNTEIGLPLAVLFLPSGYSSIFRWVDVLLTGTCISIFSRKFPKILVLEMGVDRKGDMDYLLSMVKPTIAIITNVHKSFFESGASMDDIIKELEKLAKSVPKKGTLILNGDDNKVTSFSKSAKAKIIRFGQNNKEVEIKISAIENFAAGQKFKLHFPEEIETVETERHGNHNISAIAIAKIVKKEIKRFRKSNNLQENKD